MFLYQKFKYKYTKDNIDTLINDINTEKPQYICFDTETDGLNIITSKPFLVSVCFNKNVYTFPYNSEHFNKLIEVIEQNNIPLFAHNAKYDYHMVLNGGSPIPDNVKIYDSITVARLTEFADERESMSLENLGQKYVADDAKFAGKVIKDIVNKINKARREELRKGLIITFPEEKFGTESKNGVIRGTGKLTEVIDDYFKYRTRFVNDDNKVYQYIDEHFIPANYKDVYEQEPDLMTSYAADDVVILNEYLKKALPVLEKVAGTEVLERESKLIPVIARMENVGLEVDVDYVINARKDLVAYRDLLYWELNFYTGEDFTVGQHDYIKDLLKRKYGVVSEKADEKALKYIIEKSPNEECIKVCKDILELRTLDKWISTYVDGKLNSMIWNEESKTWRIHTDMNNNGAVSGRVSCDMQQQPKNALLDRDGNELFHPRRMFICPKGYTMAFIDESQMELRVQAYYTMYVGDPDTTLCRAYMPYECYNEVTTEFDPNNLEMLKHFSKKKWYVKGTGEEWQPTDLHSETTKHAFPDVPVDSPEFKKKRKLGKQCNFLKVYQGGVGAIQSEIGVDAETAQALDQAFYKAFPKIKTYQDWVNNQLSTYGFIENLYGRRYYMNDSRQFYKGCNYLIQGTCADMVKTFEIRVDEYLKDKKSKFVLPIHDRHICRV